MPDRFAPGWPGIEPRWTSSAKEGVGTALTSASRVWFTHSHGILNEIYYARIDQACTRDFGLIVTDGRELFSEEKRHTTTTVEYLSPEAPGYRITNRCMQGRYVIEKELLADPTRDVVLQRVRFLPIVGTLDDYRLFVLLAPHLGNRGACNTAWLDDYKGIDLLYAERDGAALALACSRPWRRRSVGFVGISDGWTDIVRHGRMAWAYERAEAGNVALTGEIDLREGDGEFILSLGFGVHAVEAGHRASAGLHDDFDELKAEYLREWQRWQATLLPLDALAGESPNAYRVSTAVMRMHEEKRFRGGSIASLSIPWGFAKGDDDLGGYHLVWPRDLVETAGALLACGAIDDARRILSYLRTTQEADGHWSQNMWLDGRPYWSGVQMDETALPILLWDLIRRRGALSDEEQHGYWPMVRRAAAFLVCNGPVTQQDRWEEDPGYSPFTLAVEIAALLAAADLGELAGEAGTADFLRETADLWYAGIDRWIYATGSELAGNVGVDGYYVRIAPPETSDACSPLQGFVAIKNRAPGRDMESAAAIVSPDALALVRFGLRAADDPRILNTVKVIDSLVRVELPGGPGWRRYNGDGYGEHADGRAFDGVGVGRVWPLLTGERGHFEVAAGRVDTATELLRAMESMSNQGGLFPEQVWDADDIPEHELRRGKPSGSAMPLVWAHAEYVKLLRSVRDGRVFDTPPQTVRRYLNEKRESRYASWRFNHKCRCMPAGKTLRIETLAPAKIRFSIDGWRSHADLPTRESGLGVHVAYLPTERLEPRGTVVFTFFWIQANRWEGVDFSVEVE